MTEPERLLGGSGDDVEVALLGSAQSDTPSNRCVRRTLLALGLGAGVTAVSSAATATVATGVVATKAGASLPPAAVAASQAGIAVLVKWVGIASVAGLVTWGATTQLASRDTEVAQRPNTPLHDSEQHRPTPAAPRLPRARPTRAAPRTSVAPVAATPLTTSSDTLPVETPEANARATAAPETRKPAGAQKPPARAATQPKSAIPQASAPPQPTRSLGEEVAALDRARAAMNDDPDAALAALDDYDKGFEGGVLAQEAAVLKIEALARAGKKQRAKAAAGRFLARHPNSPLVGRVKRATR